MSNQAKDWQKGYYTILVDGKTIVVQKEVKTGTDDCGFPTFKAVAGTAQCAPEDEFDLTVGVSLAMNRLNKQLNDEFSGIKVGDKVKIKDAGLIYDGYAAWVSKNVHDIKEVARYAYCGTPNIDRIYKVIAIAPHGEESGKNLAYIKKIDGLSFPCYLISIDGLEKV